MSRQHIFPISLAVILIAVMFILPGCNKAEATDGSATADVAAADAAAAGTNDETTNFFIGMEDRLAENELASIAIIEIVDPRDNDRNKVRNVRQATMEQLAQMVDVAVREVSEKKVAEVMGGLTDTATMGLDPENVMDIGIKLGVDALLFASIESKQNDVFFWVYSAMNGQVIFSSTLKKWKLPVSDPLDGLLDLGTDTSGSGSKTD